MLDTRGHPYRTTRASMRMQRRPMHIVASRSILTHIVGQWRTCFYE